MNGMSVFVWDPTFEQYQRLIRVTLPQYLHIVPGYSNKYLLHPHSSLKNIYLII